MVYSLAAKGAGVEGYAETDWDILDVPVDMVSRRAEFAAPDKIHPSSLKENVARMEQGYWMDPATLPKQVLWACGSRILPDILPRFTVSPRFRDLVEQFEPDVHQFAPVEIYKQRNAEPVATYYWFIVGQQIDSVDRSSTTYLWEEGERGLWVDSVMNTTTWNFTKIPDARLVFSLPRIGAGISGGIRTFSEGRGCAPPILVKQRRRTSSRVFLSHRGMRCEARQSGDGPARDNSAFRRWLCPGPPGR